MTSLKTGLKTALKTARPAPKTKPLALKMNAAIKSFVGYLEGTQKAAHTIRNYRLDVLAFQKFLEESPRSRALSTIADLTPQDLENFHSWMKDAGLKTNTRRRRLMTVRRFVGYLVKRKKLPETMARELPAPHKIERVPFTVPAMDLLAAIRALPSDTVLARRNRALLWTLAETGCLVSEVAKLRYAYFVRKGAQAHVEIPGKAPRTVPVSTALHEAVMEIGGELQSDPLFLGFNRYGPMGTPITSRGVEMLVKTYAVRFGMPGLTPRTFRHSLVLQWFIDNVARDEIQRRLGLKTDYAFRSFEPILKLVREESRPESAPAPKSSSKTTSSGERPRPESEAPQG